MGLGRIDLQLDRLDLPSDVLQFQSSLRDPLRWDPSLDVFMHGAGYADRSRRTCSLQAHSHNDALTMIIASVGDHVAHLNADAETDWSLVAIVRWMTWQPLLKGNGAAHGFK